MGSICVGVCLGYVAALVLHSSLHAANLTTAKTVNLLSFEICKFT